MSGFYKINAQCINFFQIGFVQSKYADVTDRKFATELNWIRNGVRATLRRKEKLSAPPGTRSAYTRS